MLADFYWETKLDKVLDTFSELGFRKYFEEKDYGDEVDGITVVLMCQDPALNLKQRIRRSKKEKKIYIDIMLDMNQFIGLDQNQREKIVAEKLISEVPPIISKYKMQGFDLPKFEGDLKKFFAKLLQV